MDLINLLTDAPLLLPLQADLHFLGLLFHPKFCGFLDPIVQTVMGL